uniref:Uncharacterized protein n=1 Tax=Anopheles atroparvus TaxID=41427 RepID=A0AAG5DIM4_ANOAO
MAYEDVRPREDLELESAWVFIDDDGSDVSEEVEEAEEDVQTDEETEQVEKDDESTDDETDEENDEEDDGEADAGKDHEDDGNLNEENDDAGEEQSVTKEKKNKKGKVARAVKGFKKFVGGVFRPSALLGSKLKLDVDLNMNLKATYGKDPNSTGKINAPSKKRPQCRQPPKPETVTSTKKSPNSGLPAKRQILAPTKKAPVKQKKGDTSKIGTKRTSGLEGSSSSADVNKIAKLIAENERLRQRNRLLINTNENLSRICRTVGCWKFFSLQLRKIMYKF